MRKAYVLFFVGVFLLMVSLSFAQTPRDNADSRDDLAVIPSEGLTMFTNLGVTGVDIDGVPGYIQMISSRGQIFYLYIDDTNALRIASGATVGTAASPNTTDWNNAGEKVGLQD